MSTTRIRRIRVLMLTACLPVLCARARPAQGSDKQPALEDPLLQQFKNEGKNASMTILPVRLGPNSMKQVGEVVGMLLERGGMQNLEIGDAAFAPPEGADLTQTGRALGEFVKSHSPKTDYVMFAEFQVSAKRRFNEIRVVIVNKKGDLVWQDRQTKDDADFKRIKPKEPMECCVLVVERMRSVLGLSDPSRAGDGEGKLAKRWATKTGVPDQAERAALKQRERNFRKSAGRSTLLVYPAHAGDEMSRESSTHLTRLINGAGLTKASAAEQGPKIAVAGDMNEQKVLWKMAREFREHMKKEPADADYVLYADYIMGKGRVGGVHFAICDRQGELVIVDYQNSHHGDFNAIDPKSREDCDRLVVKRLGGYCR